MEKNSKDYNEIILHHIDLDTNEEYDIRVSDEETCQKIHSLLYNIQFSKALSRLHKIIFTFLCFCTLLTLFLYITNAEWFLYIAIGIAFFNMVILKRSLVYSDLSKEHENKFNVFITDYLKRREACEKQI